MTWYEFRIRGRLEPATIGAFSDLTSESEPAETLLRGQFDDQQHVTGVLTRIQDLGLELVGMRQLVDEAEAPQDEGEPR